MRPSQDDLALFRACFAKNSPRPRSLEQLRWQYVDNPTGRLYVDLAEAPEGGRLAAVYASMPGTLRLGGQRRLGLQSLDTLTDEDFRGQGLFLRLARSTFARAEADGVALIYGFPNGNSAHGFFQKLGWTSLDPVPFLIRPLRTRYVAERLKLGVKVPDLPLMAPVHLPWPGARVAEVSPDDPRVDALWASFAEGVGVAVERDGAYLRWRIGQRPDEAYRTFGLFRGDDLRALAITNVKDKHGGRIGYLMELLHRPGRHDEGFAVLRHALLELARAGADAALAWSFPHAQNRLTHHLAGFAPLPRRFWPIELHVGVRAFDPSIAPLVNDRARWYLSYLDSDTV